MFEKTKARWKKLMTTDNIIDASVDVLILVFDVLSSPILIVMRIFRFLFNKFIVDHIKSFIKYFVHKFDKNGNKNNQ